MGNEHRRKYCLKFGLGGGPVAQVYTWYSYDAFKYYSSEIVSFWEAVEILGVLNLPVLPYFRLW